MLPGIADAAECEALLNAGLQAAAKQEGSLWRRMSASAQEFTSNNKRSVGRTRVPIGTLSRASAAMYSSTFAKVLTLVDEQIPSVAALIETSFHHEEDSRPRASSEAVSSSSSRTPPSLKPSLASLHASGSLEFSAREPAINIYTAGGEFNAHTDRQTLTVLIYLTPPETCEGGGTGFWSQACADCEAAPTAVIRPPAGTALVYGGRVPHAGMPVVSGRRAIFLGSFSQRRLDLQLMEFE